MDIAYLIGLIIGSFGIGALCGLIPLNLGYKFITISSDYRSMSIHAQNIVDEMKNLKQAKEEKTY